MGIDLLTGRSLSMEKDLATKIEVLAESVKDRLKVKHEILIKLLEKLKK